MKKAKSLNFDLDLRIIKEFQQSDGVFFHVQVRREATILLGFLLESLEGACHYTTIDKINGVVEVVCTPCCADELRSFWQAIEDQAFNFSI